MAEHLSFGMQSIQYSAGVMFTEVAQWLFLSVQCVRLNNYKHTRSQLWKNAESPTNDGLLVSCNTYHAVPLPR
jgi:hypothetical protein